MIITIEEADLDADGELRVSGWAAGNEVIDTINIMIASTRIGEAERGLARKDIALQYPHWKESAYSGFVFRYTLEPNLQKATHVFVVVTVAGYPAQAATRAVRKIPKLIKKPEETLPFHCDNSALYDDGTIDIAGWATHVSGIERIAVQLDKTPLGFADYGKMRPDVGKSYPDIASALHSGFTFHTQLTPLDAGEHDIALTIHTLRGDRFVRQWKAPVQIAGTPSVTDSGTNDDPIRLFVDKPQIVDGAFVEPVQRLLALEGWAIARQGVAAVEVYLDDAPVGKASRGIRRSDIGKNFADWPESLTSGFACLLPRKLFSQAQHTVKIVVRDHAGNSKSLDIQAPVAPINQDTSPLRNTMPQTEKDFWLTLINAAPNPPLFAIAILGEDDNAKTRTQASLDAQVYRHFRILPTTQAPLAESAKRLYAGETGRLFLMRLRAGDVLSLDALLTFALNILAHEEEDFHYADDLRFDPTRNQVAQYLKPEWAPDLLLSTNYIGRAWCADANLIQKVNISAQDHDYDCVLRLTEQAHQIGHTATLALHQDHAGDDENLEKTALKAAMQRRSEAGEICATQAPGVWRWQRSLSHEPFVSIIIPTIAKDQLVETCLATLRAKTRYKAFEIVLVDNIADPQAPQKTWMKNNADCVVEYSGPFNWSKLNNLGAAAAVGDFLLFLNDDIEIQDPLWLQTLMEHAQRPEVGVVAPRLLYPDGRVQHAGLFFTPHAYHAFRFAEADERGPFGLAVAQRNVSAVTGACVLMRRSVFQQVGRFDENHPIVNNDVDMCLRLWQTGLRVVYTPHATLIHHEMASRAPLDDTYNETQFHQNWWHFFAHNDPFFHPRLSSQGHWEADPEATRTYVAGGPKLARDSVSRILVQKLDHIGDFVTVFPALRRLKNHFPQAEIYVLAPKASKALAGLEPAITHVIPFDFFHTISHKGKQNIEQAEWDALSAHLQTYHFDIAIDMRKHTDTREVLKLSNARLTVGFDHKNAFPWLDVALEWDGDTPYLSKRNLASDDYVTLVDALSRACEKDRGLTLPAPAHTPTEPLIGIHPGAGNPLRQWPAQHFATLSKMLLEEYDVNIVLLGTDNDEDIAKDILRIVNNKRLYSQVGKIPLEDLPTFLQSLTLFIGNNSGPHHIAAALGVPTVGIHSGVVSVQEWGPLGPAAVALQRDMSCGPCYLESPQACSRQLACLTQLRPADVFRVCKHMLAITMQPFQKHRHPNLKPCPQKAQDHDTTHQHKPPLTHPYP